MSTSTSTSTSHSGTKLAILDDYASLAASKFAHLSDRLQIDSFPTTLNAHDPSERAALIARLKPYTIISTMRERTAFPRDVLTQLPNLKFLLTTGSKNASIDKEACQGLGITYVGAEPPQGLPQGHSATNEHTWALLLGLAKGVAEDDRVVKSYGSGGGGGFGQGWQSGVAFGLAGKTIGILGLGRLGVQAAVTAKLGFGMAVVCWSSSLTQEKADQAAAQVGLEPGTFKVMASKRELFEQADVVSVHYVLSERSKGMVGKEELAAMKKDSLLVNTSRGPLIDEEALLEACRQGRIRGVALDVYDVEPLPKDSAWRNTEWGKKGTSQVLLSPHMGYVETRMMDTWYDQHAKNVERWLKGQEVLSKM